VNKKNKEQSTNTHTEIPLSNGIKWITKVFTFLPQSQGERVRAAPE